MSSKEKQDLITAIKAFKVPETPFEDSYNAVFKAAKLKHRYTKPKGIAYYKINDPLPAQYWVGGVYDAFITEDKDEVN